MERPTRGSLGRAMDHASLYKHLVQQGLIFLRILLIQPFMSDLDTKLRSYTFERNDGEYSEHIALAIQEATSSEYGTFSWPSSYVLSEYLWHLNKEGLQGRQIIELGCGTGLPGLVSASCGASVLLTDDSSSETVLKNTRVSLMTNNPVKWNRISLKNEENHKIEPIFLSQSKVLPLTWGCVSPDLLLEFNRRDWPDLIIAADCFYDNSSSHDSVFATLDYFFNKKPSCKFLLTHQVRSNTGHLTRLAEKWGFQYRKIAIDGSDVSGFKFPEEKYHISQEILLFEFSRGES